MSAVIRAALVWRVLFEPGDKRADERGPRPLVHFHLGRRCELVEVEGTLHLGLMLWDGRIGLA